MAAKKPTPRALEFLPLTPDRWPHFEKLFGKRGACAGCWCMWWRLKGSAFEKNQGAGNRRAMRKIVLYGEVPGILAFERDEPVGWCSVAPREAFSSLNRSPVLKRLDDKPVWSIVCFFVSKPYRQHGISKRLIEAAVSYAKENGAEIIEAYPVNTDQVKGPKHPNYMGTDTMFADAGFEVVIKRSPRKSIMRHTISEK